MFQYAGRRGTQPASEHGDITMETFEPLPQERLARARSDLRIGLPVVIDGHLVAAVETIADARIPALVGDGAATLAISRRRAETLRAPVYDGDLARLAVAPDAGGDWIRAMADPTLDLARPLKGPFEYVRDGDTAVHRAALRLAKSAQLLPAVIVRAPGGAYPDLLHLASHEAPGQVPVLARIVSGRVPLRLAGEARVHVFRPTDGGVEHSALEVGRPDRQTPPLVRLHSACFTGDVLGSLKCDCGPQLDAALAAIGAEGSGVLLYLNQEGRGIGLANKMRAYALQDQGFDTVEANHRLGFEDDERDFRIGAAILEALGFGRVRLMTNNPAKVAMLEGSGIAVAERVPLIAGENPLNAAYLDAKARKSGHIL
jgi:GTP cyclohydrolase II